MNKPERTAIHASVFAVGSEPLVSLRRTEPHFSFWMNELTERGLHDKADIAHQLAIMSKAISDIAPWLSASLNGEECDEYRRACELIFKIDQRDCAS